MADIEITVPRGEPRHQDRRFGSVFDPAIGGPRLVARRGWTADAGVRDRSADRLMWGHLGRTDVRGWRACGPVRTMHRRACSTARSRPPSGGLTAQCVGRSARRERVGVRGRESKALGPGAPRNGPGISSRSPGDPDGWPG